MPSPDPRCPSCANSGTLFMKGQRGDADTSILCECKHGRRVERERYPRKDPDPKKD